MKIFRTFLYVVIRVEKGFFRPHRTKDKCTSRHLLSHMEDLESDPYTISFIYLALISTEQNIILSEDDQSDLTGKPLFSSWDIAFIIYQTREANTYRGNMVVCEVSNQIPNKS